MYSEIRYYYKMNPEGLGTTKLAKLYNELVWIRTEEMKMQTKLMGFSGF